MLITSVPKPDTTLVLYAVPYKLASPFEYTAASVSVSYVKAPDVAPRLTLLTTLAVPKTAYFIYVKVP